MKTKFLVVAVLGLLFGGCGSYEFPFSGDIGDVKIAGSSELKSFEAMYRWTLTGSGTNMWGTSDEFYMVWREVEGDFSLVSDVKFEGDGVNPHRKMGLIIRASTAVDAVYADVAMHGDGLTSLQYRPTQGAETQEVIGMPSGSELPSRIGLERRGDRVVMTVDGQMTGEIEMAELPEKCLVGLFICSHEADVAETGHFDYPAFSYPAFPGKPVPF